MSLELDKMPYKDKEKNKECVRKYYEDNKEEIKNYKKEWQKKNKKRIRMSRKKYREEHKEEMKKQRERNYEKNKETILKRNKKWKDNNKEKRLEQAKIYQKERRKTDMNFNIKGRLRHLLNEALKHYTKTGKIWSASKYGINYKAIIEHLKPFPKDISEYHIDHRKPLCSFDLTNSEEIKIAFAPENHQWLLAKDNMIKGGRY